MVACGALWLAGCPVAGRGAPKQKKKKVQQGARKAAPPARAALWAADETLLARWPQDCEFAAAAAGGDAASDVAEIKAARRASLERRDVVFDPSRTVQCGLARCAAKWFDAVGTRAKGARREPVPGPPNAAEIEFRMGGGVAYVFMPKAGSKTIVATVARSDVAAPSRTFAQFHAAATSGQAPFVFPFVRSPPSHFASGLGQAAMHYYGPASLCYGYGHGCMAGTVGMRQARAARRQSEEVTKPKSEWGGGPAPARVSRWLAAATFAPGRPRKTRRSVARDGFRNRHIDPMAKRLLLANISFDFVGRLEHFAEDWAALNAALERRGIPSLGDPAESEARQRKAERADPPPPETPDAAKLRAEVGRYALLEPPIPPTVSDADVANICRMIEPDLDCLGGAYVAPTLCRRAPTPEDREPTHLASNRSIWNLWIQRSALVKAGGGPGF